MRRYEDAPPSGDRGDTSALLLRKYAFPASSGSAHSRSLGTISAPALRSSSEIRARLRRGSAHFARPRVLSFVSTPLMSRLQSNANLARQAAGQSAHQQSKRNENQDHPRENQCCENPLPPSRRLASFQLVQLNLRQCAHVRIAPSGEIRGRRHPKQARPIVPTMPCPPTTRL